MKMHEISKNVLIRVFFFFFKKKKKSNIEKISICHVSVGLNINFNNKKGIRDATICRK